MRLTLGGAILSSHLTHRAVRYPYSEVTAFIATRPGGKYDRGKNKYGEKKMAELLGNRRTNASRVCLRGRSTKFNFFLAKRIGVHASL